VERETIGKGVIAASDLENFDKSNILFRDQIWTKAAPNARPIRPSVALAAAGLSGKAYVLAAARRRIASGYAVQGEKLLGVACRRPKGR
jgi:hypothetical protein